MIPRTSNLKKELMCITHMTSKIGLFVVYSTFHYIFRNETFPVPWIVIIIIIKMDVAVFHLFGLLFSVQGE